MQAGEAVEVGGGGGRGELAKVARGRCRGGGSGDHGRGEGMGRWGMRVGPGSRRRMMRVRGRLVIRVRGQVVVMDIRRVRRREYVTEGVCGVARGKG